MITKTNILLDNQHSIATVSRVDVKYGTLVLIFNREGVTVTSNGYNLTINELGEVSHYLTMQSKRDLERLLRNYAENNDSEYLFDDRKFFSKFEKNIVATF